LDGPREVLANPTGAAPRVELAATEEPPATSPLEQTSPEMQSARAQLGLNPSENDALQIWPALGEAAGSSPGWTSYRILFTNRTPRELGLKLFLVPMAPPASNVWAEQSRNSHSLSSVSLPPGGQHPVELFAVGPQGGRVGVLAFDAAGQLLAHSRAFAGDSGSPLLFEVTASGAATRLLHGQRLPEDLFEAVGGRLPNLLAPLNAAPLTVRAHSAAVEPATGQPRLPARAAGYAAATLALFETQHLLSLQPAEQSALANWVLSGGVLALVVNRREDLQAAGLAHWLGGEAESKPGSDLMFDPLPLRVVPLGQRRGAPAGKIETVQLSVELQRSLASYAGGNLQPSPWGAGASFGLGEVQLLGFDPGSDPWQAEQWTQLKLLELLAHAWDRRRGVVLPHAQQEPKDVRNYGVRQYLRQGYFQHWTLLASACVLVTFAGLAGPLNFTWARRQNRPLQAYRRLSALALTALALILGIGAAARARGKQATHLTLWEAAAGMSRASATRFRALHTASLEGLHVRALSAGAVLSVANAGESVSAQLAFDADGPVLTELHARPWQTLLVREDGFAGLGQGVSLTADNLGQLQICNRLGKDLSAVVIRDVSGRLAFFENIADGERVAFEAGRAAAQAEPYDALRLSAGALSLSSFEHWLDDVVPGAAQAWDAIDELSASDVEWWPSGVPALLAQVNGGEGQLTDSGLPLTQDRVLLRVVGWGGEP
jgi:hypothetical protein